MVPSSSQTQDLIFTNGFNPQANDHDADKVARSHLQNMRYTEIENCMQRAKYYVLHYQFDDILRNYVNTMTEFVKIANFKYGYTITP
jgi:hypothetical protein